MLFDREQLYWLVWSVPVIHLCELIGVSSTSVRKACITRQVPLPDRAYWLRKRYGHDVTLTPLKSLDPSSPANRPWRIGPDHVEEIDTLLRHRAELGSQVKMASLPSAETGAPDGSAIAWSQSDRRSEQRSRIHDPGGHEVPRSIEQSCRSEPQIDRARPQMPDTVKNLAHALQTRVAMEQFIAALKEAGVESDSAASAVLTIWLIEADKVMSRSDPVAAVLETCRQVSLGRWPRFW